MRFLVISVILGLCIALCFVGIVSVNRNYEHGQEIHRLEQEISKAEGEAEKYKIQAGIYKQAWAYLKEKHYDHDTVTVHLEDVLKEGTDGR